MSHHPFTRRTATLAVVLAATALAAARAHAWQARVDGIRSLDDRGPAIAADGRGDFFSIDDGGVVKYRGANGSVAWRVALEPNVERDSANLTALVVDEAGDVVVSGALPRAIPAYLDAVLFKVAGTDGRVLWKAQPLLGDPRDGSAAFAVVTDHAGDVVLLMRRGQQVLAGKLDGRTGAVLWMTPLADDRSIGLLATLLRIDDAGHVIVAGNYPDLSRHRTTFAVAGIDPADGHVQWQRMIDTAADGATRTLAVTSSGTVITATASDTPSGQTDALVVAIDASSGAQRWQRSLDSADYDYPLGLEVDEAGNVFVAGVAYPGEGRFSAFVTALDARGNERWRFVLPRASDDVSDSPRNLAHVAGSIVLSGSFGGTDTETGSFVSIALDPDNGRERWRLTVPHDPEVPGSSAATGAVQIAPGRVVLGGVLDSRSTFDDDVLIGVDAATGAEAWRVVQNDTTSTDDTAVAVALDPKGGVVTAGTVGMETRSTNILVVKYDTLDGRERWRTAIDGEFPFEIDEDATAVATDGTGDVFVLGRLVNYDGRHPGLPIIDSTIIKLDGRDGTEIWRRSFLAPNGIPMAALRVDPQGNAVVAGELDEQRTPSVAKLDGRSGNEVWRTPLAASTSATSGLASVAAIRETQRYRLELDAAGGVVALSGSVVFSLDAADGRIAWQAAPEAVYPDSLALDASGNAVVVQASSEGLHVVKLAASDGHELWRSADTATDFPLGYTPIVTTDATGNAFVALDTGGARHPRIGLTKVGGDDGRTLWSRTLTERVDGLANAIATTENGDVVLAGWLESVTGVRQLAVFRLRGASGATGWQRRIDSAGGDSAAVAVVVDGAQNVIAAGSAFDPATGQDVTTLALDGDDGRLTTGGGPGDCPSLPRLSVSRSAPRAVPPSAGTPCRRLTR